MGKSNKRHCFEHDIYDPKCPECDIREGEHEKQLDGCTENWDGNLRRQMHLSRAHRVNTFNGALRRSRATHEVRKDDPRPRNLDTWAENMVECARIRRELAEQARAGSEQPKGEPDAE